MIEWQTASGAGTERRVSILWLPQNLHRWQLLWLILGRE